MRERIVCHQWRYYFRLKLPTTNNKRVRARVANGRAHRPERERLLSFVPAIRSFRKVDWKK